MHSRLSVALNMGTLLGLPAWSAAPRGDVDAVASAIAAAGYDAVQDANGPAYAAAGLANYGSGRVVEAAEAYEILARNRDLGHLASTLHVGAGLEADHAALSMLGAIVEASDRLAHPSYVETHRATITQDIWRTLGWIERVPVIRFNADLFHWYTGLEMQYGDFSGKLEILEPFFSRVRFIQGRISTGGIIQVSVGTGGRDQPHLGRFCAMWERCFTGLSTTPTRMNPLCLLGRFCLKVLIRQMAPCTSNMR